MIQRATNTLTSIRPRDSVRKPPTICSALFISAVIWIRRAIWANKKTFLLYMHKVLNVFLSSTHLHRSTPFATPCSPCRRTNSIAAFWCPRFPQRLVPYECRSVSGGLPLVCMVYVRGYAESVKMQIGRVLIWSTHVPSWNAKTSGCVQQIECHCRDFGHVFGACVRIEKWEFVDFPWL